MVYNTSMMKGDAGMASGWRIGMAATFFNDPRSMGGKHHLYVVISDPAKNAKEIALVNVTTIWPGVEHDKSCTFTGGEHRHIWKPSWVRYELGRIVPDSELQALLKARLIHLSDPVTPAVLKRIQEGALRSDRTPIR